METNENDKKLFFPGKQFSAQVHRHVDSGANLQCVQKRGAYVAQHKHPIIERVHAGLIERFNFPSFISYVSQPPNPWNPYFYSVGCFGPPPPQRKYENIFRSQQDNCKSAFVNKVGALFCLQETILKPLFL